MCKIFIFCSMYSYGYPHSLHLLTHIHARNEAKHTVNKVKDDLTDFYFFKFSIDIVIILLLWILLAMIIMLWKSAWHTVAAKDHMVLAGERKCDARWSKTNTQFVCWMIVIDILLISVVEGERLKELVWCLEYVMPSRATVTKNTLRTRRMTKSQASPDRQASYWLSTAGQFSQWKLNYSTS